jgi:glucose-1-phosphate adenylyltransferase
VGALRVPASESIHFGTIEIDADQRIRGFQEKPKVPKTIPGDPENIYASMGIYVFNARFLFEQLCLDATRPGSSHDFGKNIIPSIIDSHRVVAFPFRDENRKEQAYWRDVGTLDAYFAANMDLIAVDPLLNLYDDHWPIRTYHPNYPPPKFVFAEQGPKARRGTALDSMLCPGSIISGGHIERAVVGYNVRVNSFSHVEDAILLDHVNIGRHCQVRRAIIDKGVSIPPGTQIGFDHDQDRARGFTVSEEGIVVIAKADGVDHFGDD